MAETGGQSDDAGSTDSIAIEDAPEGVPVQAMLSDKTLGIGIEVHAGRNGLDRRIRNARVQKSGLALVGHFHGLESWRLQILGATEISFLETLPPDARARACQGFAGLRPCGVVITRGIAPLPELVAACDESDTALLVTDRKSSSTINAIHTWLDQQLALRTRIHGVLVSIFGLGVLLVGRSGIGKSECALDLVMRGHRLVADDVVECAVVRVGSINSPAKRVVLGSPAPLLEHHIEIRGLGILNLKDLFGVTSVCDRVQLDLVVKLEGEKDGLHLDYDRLGVDEHFHDILGVKVPEVSIPVRPGRDIAAILTIAARNELLKRAGHHGARAFRDRLENALLTGAKV